MTNSVSDTFAMLADPNADVSIEKIKHQAAATVTEQEIANVFALAHNKAWWFEDDSYDFEKCTPEYVEACRIKDEWFSIADRMKERIFEILRSEGVEIPEKGQIAVMIPFMERNGYQDRSGWWIRKTEKTVS